MSRAGSILLGPWLPSTSPSFLPQHLQQPGAHLLWFHRGLSGAAFVAGPQEPQQIYLPGELRPGVKVEAGTGVLTCACTSPRGAGRRKNATLTRNPAPGLEECSTWVAFRGIIYPLRAKYVFTWSDGVELLLVSTVPRSSCLLAKIFLSGHWIWDTLLKRGPERARVSEHSH